MTDIKSNASPTGLTPESVRRMALEYRSAFVLAAACELRVFTVLDTAPLEASLLAERLQIDKGAAEPFLNTLTALGFLQKEGPQYANSEVASRFLVDGKPEYQGDYVAFASDRVNSWLSLGERLQAGHAPKESYAGMAGADQRRTRNFLAAMHANAQPNADFIASRVDFSGCQRILDVGGGTGAYSITLAEKYKAIQADIIDLESIVTITRDYIDLAGVGDRVQAIAGDYCKRESYGSAYDAVLMFAIIHQEQPTTALQMLKNAYAALNEGGLLVLSTFFLDDEKISPMFSVMFALEMIVATSNGKAYTLREIGSLLEKAGFRGITHMDGKTGPKGLGFVTARK